MPVLQPPPPLTFRREPRRTRLHDPRRAFAVADVESEIRWNPLTGETSRICHFSLPRPPPPDLAAVDAARRATCPFCPERVGSVTPRFPEAWFPGGRFLRGDAVVFPNLFPYDDISAVVVPGPQHAVDAADVPASLVVSGLAAARDFLRACLPRLGPQASYGLVTWNHLPPAGGTQIHPHLQVVATSEPGNAVRRELLAEQAWHDAHGRPFAADLLPGEEAGGRLLGRTGGWTWTVPFAPTGLLGDCRADFPGKATVLDLDDADLAAFADGLRRALAGFAAAGLWSFNLTFFPDRTGAAAGRHWLSARLLPRAYLDGPLHVPDANFMHLLLREPFAMALPEEVAGRLRPFFDGP